MRPYLKSLLKRVGRRRERLQVLAAELEYEGRWPHKLNMVERELRLVDALIRDCDGEGWEAMSALTALRLGQWLIDTELLAEDAELDFDLSTTALRPLPSLQAGS